MSPVIPRPQHKNLCIYFLHSWKTKKKMRIKKKKESPHAK